jgi:uncharacterized lipoprotein YbaY
VSHRRPAALPTFFVTAALLAATVVVTGPAAAATATVTGALTIAERVALSDDAVAVITLIDTTPTGSAGAIIGQQRIDAPGQVPIDFSVLYEADAIDGSSAYALFASIIDGSSVWQNRTAVAVITGGPTSGLSLTLPSVPSGGAALTGSIQNQAGPPRSPDAVAIAALIKQDTGTLVSRSVITTVPGATTTFSIRYDPGLVDPDETYVVKAAVVDGAAVSEDRTGVVAIEGGQPVSDVQVTVTAVPPGIPIQTPRPTATPEPTDAPTEAPTATPEASGTAEPTEAPTASPEPTAEPTPEPTEEPTASPTPTPSPTPSHSATPTPTVEPSPTPVTGPVTGTLTFDEPHELTPEAFAAVALIHGSGRPSETSIVASEVMRDIGQVPVAFELDFDADEIDPAAHYTIQATIVDGEDAWVTANGVDVLTRGAPTDVDIELEHRPDLIKGEVTGQVTAVGLLPAADAYAITVLEEVSTGDTLGIYVRDSDGELPIPFGIGFNLATIDRDDEYVIVAEINDGTDATWRTLAGVPVITKGNPTSDVQVVVSEIFPLTPTPQPTVLPLASPPPDPGPGASGGASLLLILVLIGAVVAIGAAAVARLRSTPE